MLNVVSELIRFDSYECRIILDGESGTGVNQYR